MSELSEAKFMAVRIKLRQYYNDVADVIEEDLDEADEEQALMLLDDKYAEIIAALL